MIWLGYIDDKERNFNLISYFYFYDDKTKTQVDYVEERDIIDEYVYASKKEWINSFNRSKWNYIVISTSLKTLPDSYEKFIQACEELLLEVFL